MKITANAYTALISGCKYVPSVPTNPAVSSINNSPQHTVEEVTLNEINSAKEAWFNGTTKLTLPKEDTYPM